MPLKNCHESISLTLPKFTILLPKQTYALVNIENSSTFFDNDISIWLIRAHINPITVFKQLIIDDGVTSRSSFFQNIFSKKSKSEFQILVCRPYSTPEKLLNEKVSKNWVLRGLNLRGLRWNQISTLYFIYQNDQRKKIYAMSDFGN